MILSLFPGIDLLGRAFEEVGYQVVRGPDWLWGGDCRSFHPQPGIFEGIRCTSLGMGCPVRWASTSPRLQKGSPRPRI